jgi:hypothetical protein
VPQTFEIIGKTALKYLLDKDYKLHTQKVSVSVSHSKTGYISKETYKIY